MSETSRVRITLNNVVFGIGAMMPSGCATAAYARGGAPVVPSPHCNRYAYRQILEHGDLVISRVLGMTIAPVRLGVQPTIGVDPLSERDA